MANEAAPQTPPRPGWRTLIERQDGVDVGATLAWR